MKIEREVKRINILGWFRFPGKIVYKINMIPDPIAEIVLNIWVIKKPCSNWFDGYKAYDWGQGRQQPFWQKLGSVTSAFFDSTHIGSSIRGLKHLGLSVSRGELLHLSVELTKALLVQFWGKTELGKIYSLIISLVSFDAISTLSTQNLITSVQVDWQGGTISTTKSVVLAALVVLAVQLKKYN